MKVLHVIPSLSPKRGGPTEATLALVQHLNQHHIESEIVTSTDDGPGVLDVQTGKLITYQGVPARFFPRYSPWWSRRLREYAYAPGFSSWLEKNLVQYDLIHIHALFSYFPTRAMVIARKHHRPYLIIPHGLLGLWPLQQRAWLKRIYSYFWTRENLNKAQCLHYCSEAEREEASVLGLTTPSEVIPHGMDLPEIIPQAGAQLRVRFHLPADEKIILFLSRLHHKKGLDLLLPEVAKLPKVRLILAGEGDAPYESWLQAELTKRNLVQRTVRTGFAYGHLKNLLLQGADLLALTSRHENFGLVVPEALASGTPVLISEQVALANDVRAHHLGAVTTLEPEEIQRGLQSLLSWSEPKPVLRLRNFVAENYSWPSVAKKTISLYEKILARHQTSSAI